jgi:hypothetical protein
MVPSIPSGWLQNWLQKTKGNNQGAGGLAADTGRATRDDGAAADQLDPTSAGNSERRFASVLKF